MGVILFQNGTNLRGLGLNLPDQRNQLENLTNTPINTLPPSSTRAATVTALLLVPTNTPTLRPTKTVSPTPLPSATRPTATPVNSPTPEKKQWHMVIGQSVEGRPLEVYRFGDGPAERLIVAGIHGGSEWNTIALADELIAHLEDHPELVPQNNSLFILRNINPDGDARAHSPDGRVNANGVDLNRNWDADWKKAWRRSGCWSLRATTAGPYPASEPETQALMDFLLARNVDALINYHSAALGIFPSGNPPHPDSIRLAEAIAAVSRYPYPPINTNCRYSGTLVDWALNIGIAGVDVELTDHLHTDFKVNLRILSVLLEWQP